MVVVMVVVESCSGGVVVVGSCSGGDGGSRVL